MAVEYHSIDGRDRLDGRERRPQRAASKRAGAHRMASQRATAARHSQITHLRTVPAVPDDPDARARRRRVRRSVYPVVGTRATRIALSIWPTDRSICSICYFDLVFPLKLSQQVYHHPIQLARVSHGASPLPSCDPAPRALIHARMGRSLSFTYTSMNMYSTPPWTLSSNSAANGGRGGRPRAPRAARPSQA